MPTSVLTAGRMRRDVPARDWGALAFVLAAALLFGCVLAQALLDPPPDEVQAALVMGGP